MKLIVITGASSGIGEALAKTFSKEGHPLLLLARRLDRIEALKLPKTLCEKVDVTDREAFQKAVQKAEEKFGEVDLLINNAGMMLLDYIEKQNPTEWDQMIEVNIRGVMNGVFAVIEKMVQRKGGTIVNISSIAGIKAFPQHAGYCATKFAVRGFTESVREEVSSQNVRLITISPGVVDTELLTHTTSEKVVSDYKDWEKSSNMERLKPQDIADSIHFAYKMPQRVNIREIVIAPTAQGP